MEVLTGSDAPLVGIEDSIVGGRIGSSEDVNEVVHNA
jgi:hypothetical protein